MELSDHLWPEDLELAIPIVHSAARSPHNPLLLLVKTAGSFEGSPWDVLCEILQRGILPENRSCRVAVLTAPDESRDSEGQEKEIPGVQVRIFSCSQRREAEAWLLSFATPPSLPPVLG